MKKILGYGCFIPILTIISYTCIYFFKLSYFRTFGIPAILITIFIEDFFIPGLIIFVFLAMFIFVFKVKYIEKPSFGLLEQLEKGSSLKVFIFIIVVLGIVCLISKTSFIFSLLFICISLFLCFIFRIFSSTSLNIDTYIDVITTIIMLMLTSWLLGLFISTSKTTFLVTNYNKNSLYVLVDKNSPTTGVFKIYNKKTHTFDKNILILDIAKQPLKPYKIQQSKEQLQRANIVNNIKNKIH